MTAPDSPAPAAAEALWQIIWNITRAGFVRLTPAQIDDLVPRLIGAGVLLAQQPPTPAPTQSLSNELDALKAEYATLEVVDNGLWYPLGLLIEMLEKQLSVARAVEWWREQVLERRAALAESPS